MPHIITDECIMCGNCADECPVNCITAGDSKFVIDAEACIDCGSCEGVCPTGAAQAQ